MIISKPFLQIWMNAIECARNNNKKLYSLDYNKVYYVNPLEWNIKFDLEYHSNMAFKSLHPLNI